MWDEEEPCGSTLERQYLPLFCLQMVVIEQNFSPKVWREKTPGKFICVQNIFLKVT